MALICSPYLSSQPLPFEVASRGLRPAHLLLKGLSKAFETASPPKPGASTPANRRRKLNALAPAKGHVPYKPSRKTAIHKK